MKLPFFPKLERNAMNALFEIHFEINQNKELKLFIENAINNYYPWEKFSNLKFPTSRFNEKDLWFYIKTFGRPHTKETKLLVDKQETPFWYCQTDKINEQLHKIDMEFSGNPILNEYTIDPHYQNDWAKKRVITSLVEEAISSSQMEGAAISRRQAKELIRSGKQPKSKSEMMVINNYHTIQHIKSDLIEKPASISLILDMHRQLTQNTLDSPEDTGKFRQDLDEADKVNVYDNDGVTVLHVPPPAESLSLRMENLCEFINNKEPFIHPVVKAIIIHFAIGYIHPFYDGNGRVARGLFYWFLLKNGYKLFEFISISEFINKSIGQYKRAFLYTELDDNDLTYFINFHLSIINQCLESLKEYIHKKSNELKTLKENLRNIPNINIRQLDLLNHALKHSDDVEQKYTIESHENSNGISWATARSDLLDLADRGFLEKRKLGKMLCFYIPTNLDSIISEANTKK